MKTKLSALSVGMASALVLMTAASSLHAQQTLYVKDPFGNAVKDPFGKCIISPSGTVPPGCTAEQVAAVTPPPSPTPTVETLTMGADAFFDFDRAELKPAGRESLDRLVADMRSARNINRIEVVGHTDSKGTEQYNQRLSERRAQAVQSYLISRGVDPSIISARGEGELRPIASNDTAAGRAQNRRVEITVEAVK